MQVESEYRRHGTLAYLAAYDVHRARVIGHCAPSTGIEPFTAHRLPEPQRSVADGQHWGGHPAPAATRLG